MLVGVSTMMGEVLLPLKSGTYAESRGMYSIGKQNNNGWITSEYICISLVENDHLGFPYIRMVLHLYICMVYAVFLNPSLQKELFYFHVYQITF